MLSVGQSGDSLPNSLAATGICFNDEARIKKRQHAAGNMNRNKQSDKEKAPETGALNWCRHHESNTGPTDYKS